VILGFFSFFFDFRQTEKDNYSGKRQCLPPAKSSLLSLDLLFPRLNYGATEAILAQAIENEFLAVK